MRIEIEIQEWVPFFMMNNYDNTHGSKYATLTKPLVNVGQINQGPLPRNQEFNQFSSTVTRQSLVVHTMAGGPIVYPICEQNVKVV